MKIPISHYISELLFLHDCVILPGFGGFVGDKKSATLNRKTGILTPPRKQLLFNKNLNKNDGLLVNHLVNQEELSNKEAHKIVTLFSDECNAKLNKSKVLRIDKVGLLILGEDENIIFTQDDQINYSLDSFGMQSISNKVILRKTITEEKVEKTIKILNSTNKNPKVILKVAAIILPLITLSYLSIVKQEKIHSVYSQMADLNPFSTFLIDEEPLEINENSSIPNEENIETPIIKLPENNITSNLNLEQENTYYIIAGAFAEQKNAEKMQRKLSRWNYNSEILNSNHKLVRVSYESFRNKEDAILTLNKIRKENPSAWLLTK